MPPNCRETRLVRFILDCLDLLDLLDFLDFLAFLDLLDFLAFLDLLAFLDFIFPLLSGRRIAAEVDRLSFGIFYTIRNTFFKNNQIISIYIFLNDILKTILFSP